VPLNSTHSSALCPVSFARRRIGGPPPIVTGSVSRMVRSSSMTRGPSIQAPPATGVSRPASCNTLM
jgi:hypothetical protein